MKVTYEHTFQAPLTSLGAELVEMIKNRNYNVIADQFGYARAFDRQAAEAIASDISFCLSTDGRSAIIAQVGDARILVKYFKQPNSSNLFGLVECFLPLEQDDGELLAELIVTTKDAAFYVCLEDVSYAA